MLDANEQRSWQLAGESDFLISPDQAGVTWDDKHNVLRFRSSRTIDNLRNDRARAFEITNQAPVTMDAFGTWATVNMPGNTIIAGGVFENPAILLVLPEGETVVDMAMGTDGVLYAVSRNTDEISTIYLINRSGSKEEGKIEAEGYNAEFYETSAVRTLHTKTLAQPDRVVALPGGGALLLDRERKSFFQVTGEPYRDQPAGIHSLETPRPCDDFAPVQKLIQLSELLLPENHSAVAMASSLSGDVAVLIFPDDAEDSAKVVLIRNNIMSAPVSLAFTGTPFSIGWAGDNIWAFMFPDLREAIAYPVNFSVTKTQNQQKPLGLRYPLNFGVEEEFRNRPFVNALSNPVCYPSSRKKGILLPRPLHHLSYPAYPLSTFVDAKDIIDSKEPGTTWHRIYLEAHLPRGTGLRILLASAENASELDELTENNDSRWMEHQFGIMEANPDIPKGVWIKDPSEIPFHKGLLHCSPVKDRSGLFTVLIQRPGYKVRSLKGRYLKVRLELLGSGHETPEIAAIRIYSPRFSYLDKYLPELYRETIFGNAANEIAPATGPDFLGRFLCLFESLLTPLEDKVAAAHIITNPISAPPEALDWLSGWIAAETDTGYPEIRKRRYIKEATRLHRLRGTIKGLSLALDLATDNRAQKGEIVLLEDFRLRRTFATILGADLSVENDPLLMGKLPNANSYIGETLILGEESKKEFLALYSDDLNKFGNEQGIIDNFYAQLANRLTVLVHKNTGEEDLALIRRIVTNEIPAHIDFRIVAASKPLLIGLYSMLKIDTYLQEEPGRNIARVGSSCLGRNDFIKKLPVLDDRLEP